MATSSTLSHLFFVTFVFAVAESIPSALIKCHVHQANGNPLLAAFGMHGIRQMELSARVKESHGDLKLIVDATILQSRKSTASYQLSASHFVRIDLLIYGC